MVIECASKVIIVKKKASEVCRNTFVGGAGHVSEREAEDQADERDDGGGDQGSGHRPFIISVAAAGPPVSQTPSPVVSRWLPILRDRLGDRRDVLDLAMGAGRHARAAAGHGFRVFGVDRDLDRVRLARTGALEHARLWVADLETAMLPRDRFDLVICTNYLQRSIWPALRERGPSRGVRHLRDVHRGTTGPWHRPPVPRPPAASGRAAGRIRRLGAVPRRRMHGPGRSRAAGRQKARRAVMTHESCGSWFHDGACADARRAPDTR